MLSEIFGSKKVNMIEPENAIVGREQSIIPKHPHAVLGHTLLPPFSENMEYIQVALGCFWGAERKFWQLEGVYTTAVGYAGGYTQNPTYEEVCTGQTGHTEVVLVVFDPSVCSLATILECFWESHDPTQGMRQGNDVGTQYRSAIYVDNQEQLHQVESSKAQYQTQLTNAGFGEITTEIGTDKIFYYAEEYHQQYLAKNPNGYCGLGGTGVGFK